MTEFTAYCPECRKVTVMENIGHLVKCHECGFIVLGNGVIEDNDRSVDTGTNRDGGDSDE